MELTSPEEIVPPFSLHKGLPAQTAALACASLSSSRHLAKAGEQQRKPLNSSKTVLCNHAKRQRKPGTGMRMWLLLDCLSRTGLSKGHLHDVLTNQGFGRPHSHQTKCQHNRFRLLPAKRRALNTGWASKAARCRLPCVPGVCLLPCRQPSE